MQNPEAVIAALENAPGIILPLVREVPAAVLKRRPKPGKWSAHEHACHLAVVHKIFSPRLEAMLNDRKPRIVPYNPDQNETEDHLLLMDLDESLQRFVADRRQLVEKIKALQPEDWNRTAEHPEYSHYSVFVMFRHLALHDLFHAYRIEELLLKKDWE
ncbi:MAG: DinB family protein [Acidobacteria bacterium]|nr:DinB family protein [Acidobacteriota bacterium]